MINEDGWTEQIPNKIPNFVINGFKIVFERIFWVIALKTFYLIQILTLNFPSTSEMQGPGIGFASYWVLGKFCPDCFQMSSWPTPATLGHMHLFGGGRNLLKSESVYFKPSMSETDLLKLEHLMWSNSHCLFLCIWWMLMSCFRFPSNDLL